MDMNVNAASIRLRGLSIASARARVDNAAILARVQTRHFALILNELETLGRKETHWIWWVFPNARMGQSDMYATFIRDGNETMRLMRLLSSRVKKQWLKILKHLYKRVVITSIPSADLGRIEACSTSPCWIDLKPRHVKDDALALKIRNRILKYHRRIQDVRR